MVWRRRFVQKCKSQPHWAHAHAPSIIKTTITTFIHSFDKMWTSQKRDRKFVFMFASWGLFADDVIENYPENAFLSRANFAEKLIQKSRCTCAWVNLFTENSPSPENDGDSRWRHGFSMIFSRDFLSFFFSFLLSRHRRLMRKMREFVAYPSVFRSKWRLIGRVVALVMSSVHCDLFTL